MSPTVSALVRTLDSGSTLEQCISSLRGQRTPVDIIVIDSGSSDDTVGIAEAKADRVLHLTRADFTFGRALNLAAGASDAQFHIALSSHCALPDEGWVETALQHFDNAAVAATTGRTFGPDNAHLDAPLVLDRHIPIPNPYWSFSNHAAMWRADVWRQFPFDEHLEAGEDTDWADRVVAAGHSIVYDPELLVSDGHRRKQGTVARYRRRKRETRGLAAVRAGVAVTFPQVVAQWWRIPPMVPSRTVQDRVRARLSPFRLTLLAGEWAASRELRKAGHEPRRAAR